jgi:hypothetical protein
VRRSDAGGRLELLYAIALNDAPEGRKHRLAFLAEHLTDDTARDRNQDPHRFGVGSAGSAFPQLEVRNFAAMRLALLLEIDVSPNKEWTAAQWAELREKVRVEVAKELGR